MVRTDRLSYEPLKPPLYFLPSMYIAVDSELSSSRPSV